METLNLIENVVVKAVFLMSVALTIFHIWSTGNRHKSTESDRQETQETQETMIFYSRDEDSATVYTSDPAVMAKLDRLVCESENFYESLGYIENRNGKIPIQSYRIKNISIMEDINRMKLEAEELEPGKEDHTKDCLLADEESVEDLLTDEKTTEEDICLPADVREVIGKCTSYKSRIKSLNRQIKNKAVSDKIDQMESILRLIIERVRNDPSSAACLRRLAEYYLPTTEKLLDSYKELDRQPLQGGNIIDAKKEIEKSLEELNHALTGMLNDMFQDMAMDISSDASVMHFMLKRDGLIDEEIRMQAMETEKRKKEEANG